MRDNRLPSALVDGWVKTGDIGRLDENGYLCMLDRADDMVISGGFNIYPAELTDATAAHPAVVEVEAPCAMVCVKPEASVTEKELVELCSVHLGNYKRPGKVVLRGTTRCRRRPSARSSAEELREPFWVGRERRVAAHRWTRAALSVRMSQGGPSILRAIEG